MFTWASESAIVMSESSRARSSASTWMLTRNIDWPVGAHSTSCSRSGWLSRLAALVQSLRCTETPPPLVTKPRMSSGGTGVQHLASLTQTSGAPLTMTPVSPPAGVRGAGAAGDRDGLGEVLGGAVVAAVQVDDPAYDGLRARGCPRRPRRRARTRRPA